MTFIEAIILGIIQGATEFLPISSSGHLILLPSILNLDEPNLNAIAIAHQGTLLAVLFYFRHDLWQIIRAVLAGLRAGRPWAETQSRLGWYIALGSLPAVVVGLLFADNIDRLLASPGPAAAALIVTGVILIIGERLLTGYKNLSGMRWGDALTIGLAQALALVPGISRSGITISAGLSRGLDRETAARYSFLLGVPAIAGAGLLAAVDLLQSATASEQILELLVTFAAAAVVGYGCIHFLLNWLRQRTLYLFAGYCLAFGAIYLLLSWLG
ncbi:MAG: undecaprenyl-diphosphatase UppP [Chloroflexota bacterium]